MKKRQNYRKIKCERVDTKPEENKGERKTYYKIIEEYKKNNLPNLKQLLNYFSCLSSLKKVIEEAPFGMHGKKHPHQFRIKSSILRKMKQILLKYQDEIKNCENFNKLYELIYKNKIKGIGGLTVYDIALRIGAFLKKLPEKEIYLHAGTLKGYKKLMKINRKMDGLIKVDVSSLPSPFCKMKGYEAEDLLCIYRDCF